MPTGIWMYKNHPYQYVYFNFLAGKNFNEKFEMDYYGVSNKSALEYIIEKNKGEAKIYNLNTTDLYLSKKILEKVIRKKITIVDSANNADYITNNYTDWRGKTNPTKFSVPENFKVIYEIKVDNIAINTIYKFLIHKELEGSTIAISGIGKVGSKLSKLLFKQKVNLIISNIGKDAIDKLKKDKISFTETDINSIFERKCDIISPCALGGSINSEVKKKLKCKAIVGAANNQLDKPETAVWLKEHNIFYVPDYLVNSGGVIAISCEINNSEYTLDDQLNKISDKVLLLIKESQKSSLSTDQITEDLAWKRING